MAHGFYRIKRNTGVLAAIQTQHRGIELSGDVHRMFWRIQRFLAHQFAIPGDSRFELRIVCGIQPANASAPAEAGDHQTVRVAAVTRRPAGNVVEIGQHLRVRDFADQIAEQRWNIAIVVRIALTEVEFWRNGQISFKCQATAEVANMFVNPKNLLNHNHDGQRTVCRFWSCVPGRHILPLRGNGGLSRRNGLF